MWVEVPYGLRATGHTNGPVATLLIPGACAPLSVVHRVAHDMIEIAVRRVGFRADRRALPIRCALFFERIET